MKTSQMIDGHQNTLAGIHAEIAGARYEYWSSFAPLPVDVVLDAGQKAKENIGKNGFECL